MCMYRYMYQLVRVPCYMCVDRGRVAVNIDIRHREPTDGQQLAIHMLHLYSVSHCVMGLIMCVVVPTPPVPSRLLWTPWLMPRLRCSVRPSRRCRSGSQLTAPLPPLRTAHQVPFPTIRKNAQVMKNALKMEVPKMQDAVLKVNSSPDMCKP